MSVYTLTLKQAHQMSGGTHAIGGNGETLVTAPGTIGLGSYPIFDADYRDHLNGLIFDHYMNREIGMESISMFAHAVRRSLNVSMQVFNKLYEANRIEFDPLSTVDIRTVTSSDSSAEAHNAATRTQTGSSEGTAGSDNETKSGTRSINQDFPQHMLAGNADYATNGSDATAYTDNSGTSTNTGSTTEAGSSDTDETSSSTANTDSRTSGYQGSAAALLTAYRESLFSVDQLVIDSLADCFMGVYDVPNPYTPTEFTRSFYNG